MSVDVALRPLEAADLPLFFEHQRDPIAVRMIGFAPRDPDDRAAFDAHWARITALPTCVHCTIVVDGAVAGYVSKFEREGFAEVCYVLGRSHWGRGIATAALRKFLSEVVTVRPICAHVAHDNVGSRRVLEACGFREVDRVASHSEVRGGEMEEIRYELGATDRTTTA